MGYFSVNADIFILPGVYVEHVNTTPAVMISAAAQRCSIFKIWMQKERSIRSTVSGNTVPIARCCFR